MTVHVLSRRRHDVQRLALVAGAIGALGIGLSSATAALLVYEPFDYDAGSVLHGMTATGQNLSGAYQASQPGLPDAFQLTAQSPGLSYGNLGGAPDVIGNRLSQTTGTTANTATVSVDEDVLIDPGQAIFWSALLTLDDSSNGNRLAGITLSDDNGDALSFGESVVGLRAIRVTADTTATGGLVAAGDDFSFANGQTMLLVGRYFNSPAADGDQLGLIGYDTADADLLPSFFDPADPNAEFSYALTSLDIDFARISTITFGIRGDTNNFIDELRIGSTYGSVVVPEPAAIWLAAGIAAIWLRPR